MKEILKYLIILLTCICIFGSNAFAKKSKSDVSIYDLELTPFNTPFYLLPNKRGAKQVLVKNKKNIEYKVKVIKKRGGMYLVYLFVNNKKLKMKYLINKKSAEKVFNLRAAIYAANLARVTQAVGIPPSKECLEVNRTYNKQKLKNSSQEAESKKRKNNAGSFKPGCQALAGSINISHTKSLVKCIQSIREAVTHGARDKNGKLNREKLFCNLYSRLTPEEQNFAGLVFTSVGEAGIINKRTNKPKYIEPLFVMNTMQTRLKRARKKVGTHLNNLDIALSKSQFSMYNRSIFNHKKHTQFKEMFEPGNNLVKKDLKNGVMSFIALHDTQKLKQKKTVNRIDMYFNPHGMQTFKNYKKARVIGSLKFQYKRAHPFLEPYEINDAVNEIYKASAFLKEASELSRSELKMVRAAKNYAARKVKEKKAVVTKLLKQGKLPLPYPNNRIAPSWNFKKLKLVKDLSYNGIKAHNKKPYMHAFYAKRNGSSIMTGTQPPKERKKCLKK